MPTRFQHPDKVLVMKYVRVRTLLTKPGWLWLLLLSHPTQQPTFILARTLGMPRHVRDKG